MYIMYRVYILLSVRICCYIAKLSFNHVDCNTSIRNTEEAVWGSQYSPRLSYLPKPIGPRSGVYCGLSTASEVFLILLTSYTIFLCVFLSFALFSDEPEVSLPKYSQTAVLHASHFRRVYI